MTALFVGIAAFGVGFVFGCFWGGRTRDKMDGTEG